MLSAFSEGLKKRQEMNVELDVKKNILKSVRLNEPLTSKTTVPEALNIYESKIQELVIDENGNSVAGIKPSDIKETEKNLHPVYIYREGDQIMAYSIPIVGQGLWSTLYGYLALERDATTVRGVTFYKHGETPGLGGEIEKDWFQDNFKGKTIYSKKENKLTPIAVIKGKVQDIYRNDKEGASHHVDGITAATITGNGVTELVAKWLEIYEPYFKKIR